ncbi:MAG: hypothetical protein CM15mP110_2430 [Alphaproteobacteria bacterium]|nr:MAG: hypothetical protein CM15mP110_2430 [Alphaproteobacteria bacterium]
MLDFLRDYAYEMSELSQALNCFLGNGNCKFLCGPIPIAVQWNDRT